MIIFVLGLLTTQIVNILLQYKRRSSTEYLFYAIYLSTFLIYLTALNFDAIFPFWKDNASIQHFTNFIHRPIGVLTYVLYNLFSIRFLDLKKSHLSLYKILRAFNIYLLATFFLTFVVGITIQDVSSTGKFLYLSFSIIVFTVSLYILWRIWQIRTKLSAYIIIGSMCLTGGIFITNILNYLIILQKLPSAEYYLYPLFIGLGLEIYFFNSGLQYKNTAIEKDLINTQQLLIEQMKEKEKLLIDSQEIRNKIARDLHDNIGATLSSIAIYSKVAHIKNDENKKGELNSILEKITNTSTNMVGEMNDTVWAIQTKNDDMGKIINRMESFARPLLASRNIAFTFEYTSEINAIQLSMEKRKNLFLIFKETINNAVKYSAAKQVKTTLQLQNAALQLLIIDDGIGFNMQQEMNATKNTTTGNGLINIKSRAKEIDANLIFTSTLQKGTLLQLTIIIP
jgi:signal transduction histidine kinase